MAFFKSKPKCICGKSLTKTTPNKTKLTHVCDGCFKECGQYEAVYWCKLQNSIHSSGYALCADCIANGVSSNVAFESLGQLGYTGFNERVNALQQSNGDLQGALKILERQKKTVNDVDYKQQYDQEKYKNSQLDTKYQQLQSEMQQSDEQVSLLQLENNRLQLLLSSTQEQNNAFKNQINQLFVYKKEAVSLKQQIAMTTQAQQKTNQYNQKLQSQISKLLDDKKEMELTINELKKEIKSLEMKNIDETNFMNWNHEQILSWISSIDDGYFNKYYNVLSQELSDCELKGNDLVELSTKDIRGLGIKVFADAKKLEKFVKELINKYGNNSSAAPIITSNNEGKPPTAYI